eukprot:43232-Chlamydomonas_euryale.AAC.1
MCGRLNAYFRMLCSRRRRHTPGQGVNGGAHLDLVRGVDEVLHYDARLFVHLARRAVLALFARVDLAAWEAPAAGRLEAAVNGPEDARAGGWVNGWWLGGSE